MPRESKNPKDIVIRGNFQIIVNINEKKIIYGTYRGFNPWDVLKICTVNLSLRNIGYTISKIN